MTKIDSGQFYSCLEDSIESRMIFVRPRNIGINYWSSIIEMRVLDLKFCHISELIENSYVKNGIKELSRRFYFGEIILRVLNF